MEVIFDTVLLGLAAFWLGALPFALWTGKWMLGKDIRNYGDGNPGAVNVFRAGGPKAGTVAMLVEIAKGVPFVVLAYTLFNLPNISVLIIGLCAILGHAFSPILRFKGGKALAVTGGVLFSIPYHDIILVLIILMLLVFLIIEIDGWRVVLSTGGTLTYYLITTGNSLQSWFLLCILALFVVKQFEELKTMPKFKGKLVVWLQSRRSAHLSRH